MTLPNNTFDSLDTMSKRQRYSLKDFALKGATWERPKETLKGIVSKGATSKRSYETCLLKYCWMQQLDNIL